MGSCAGIEGSQMSKEKTAKEQKYSRERAGRREQ